MVFRMMFVFVYINKRDRKVGRAQRFDKFKAKNSNDFLQVKKAKILVKEILVDLY